MMKGMGHHDWSWLCGGFVVEWIEGLVVMRRITCAQVVVAAIAVGCLLSPPQVLAQTTGTASAVPSSVGGLDGQCPKMQFVVVNSAADSFDDSGADTGFLGGVVGPVVRDANDGQDVDKSGGFTQRSTDPMAPSTETATITATKPEPVPTTGGDWRDQLKQDLEKKEKAGDAGKQSAAPVTKPAAALQSAGVKPVVASVTTASPVVPSTQASMGASKKSPGKVGRTYVNLASQQQTGSFIPGVHKEGNPSWRETVGDNKEQVNGVLKQIHEKCPDTKVSLVGENEGAAVVSEIARDIGAGKGVIDADHVAGVATFADPTRSEDQPTIASGSKKAGKAPGTSGKNVDQVEIDSPTTKGSGVATVAEEKKPSDYGTLNDRTMSWCVDGDTRCGVKKGAPLARLVKHSQEHADFAHNPEQSMNYVAQTLGPAVALAGVESLAEDVDFGTNGFTFKRAKSVDDTLIGRITANAETKVDQSEVDRRLVAAGAQLGGMALAAGVTVAKKVITPSNIAQIAAASALGPEAAGLVVAEKLIEASTDLFTPETASTGAMRVVDEAKASGMEDTEIAEVAVEAAVGETIGDGAYSNPTMKDGQSPKSATTKYLSALAADALGDEAPAKLVSAASKTEAARQDYDDAASKKAVDGFGATTTTTAAKSVSGKKTVGKTSSAATTTGKTTSAAAVASDESEGSE